MKNKTILERIIADKQNEIDTLHLQYGIDYFKQNICENFTPHAFYKHLKKQV